MHEKYHKKLQKERLDIKSERIGNIRQVRADTGNISPEKVVLAICTKLVEPWWISEKLSKKFST